MGLSFWENRRDWVIRSAMLCVVAFALGFGMGLAAPRITTVVGTSLIGVIALVLGIGTWITAYQPDWWATIEAHPSWFLGTIGLTLLMSIMTQITHRRPAAASDTVAMPAAA
jgi:hypothetical protein